MLPTLATMASRSLVISKTYPALLRAVQTVMLTGQREIEQAWVRTYHETGRLIHQHLRLHQDRAEYGTKVIPKLAGDTGAHERTLYQCVQFYRCFPILNHGSEFSWAHYRVLCQVEEEAVRTAVMQEAAREHWSSPQLIERVRALNAAGRAASAETVAAPGGSPPPRLLVPKRGIAGRYRLVALAEGLAVDVGFKLYLPLLPGQVRSRAVGEIVEVAGDGSIAATPAGGTTDLFTYHATIRRVIDGDTLEVAVSLPHFVMREKLRLRGIDCPEIDTPEGKAAKRVVEALAAAAVAVTIVTSKVDKYDRYLADVYLQSRTGEEIFLNNHLLSGGHAQRMEAAAALGWLP